MPHKSYPIPDTFADDWNCVDLLVEALAAKYGVSTGVIYRWKKTLVLPRRVVGLRSKENHPEWDRGRVGNGQGYVQLRMPDHPHASATGYVREHRYVMEQHLGRYLLPTEAVHHRDGVRHHNDISNLELFANNGDHMRATTHFVFPDDSVLIEMYQVQMMSSRQIALHHNCTHLAVTRALRRLDIVTRSRAESRANRSLPETGELEVLWSSHTADEIGRMYGMTKAGVLRHMKLHGLVAPRRSGQRTGLGFQYPDDETLRSMQATMSAKQMAETLGCAYYGLTSYLSQRGIHKYGRKPVPAASTTPLELIPMSHPSPPLDAPASP